MDNEIPLAALKEVPFFRSDLDPAHPILSLQFYVDEQWHCWLPHDDKLVKVKMWPVESNYFGDKPERKSDQHFALLDMMAQHTFGSEMQRGFQAISNDFQGLSASLGKLRLFYESRDNKSYGITRFVQCEIEYLAILCRSIFDLLQEIVGAHVARLAVLDGPKPRKLPNSFRDVVRKNNRDQTSSEIASRYDLPTPIAEWYARHCPFFITLRSIRDAIIHRGATIDLIFATERGFAVSRKNDPFRGLYDWPSDCELPNSLVPVRPALATMVTNTLLACDDFAATLLSSVNLPPQLAPKLTLYSRGTNDEEFANLDNVIAHSQWHDT